jgi:peroxiredoxin
VLEPQLADQRRRALARRNPRERPVRAAAIDVVSGNGLAQRAIGVGGRAPHFVLRDGSSGAVIDTRRLLQAGPVVVCFYRGGWYPYCNLELRAYRRTPPGVQRLGATPIAVSPELPDRTSAAATSHGLGFPVLSDPGNDVAAFSGRERAEVPLPATYVMGIDGIVRFAFADANYTRRAEPDDVLCVVLDLRRADHAEPQGAQ